MKRTGTVLLALALFGSGVWAQTQQAPAKSPAAPPGKAPSATAPAQTSAGQTPADKTPAPESAFKTQKEKVSYAIGVQMGMGLKAEQIDVDSAVITQGLKDALSGAKLQMSEADLRQVIVSLQTEIRQKQMQAQQAAAAENKTKGDAFLTENAKKEGVVALPDGLQYKILAAGQGKKPLETDTVLCNYKGTFLDGTVFDSSERAGKPVPFEVSNVIPGFKEVLQLMPVGSKWQVFIPSNLAYGERGAGGGAIGPNATLIFEIELVGIQDKQPASGGAPPTAGSAPAGGTQPKP